MGDGGKKRLVMDWMEKASTRENKQKGGMKKKLRKEKRKGVERGKKKGFET